MKFGTTCLIGGMIFAICGCNTLDFDYFKEKPKEEKPARSKYSILASPEEGARVVDSGSAESDAIEIPEKADANAQPPWEVPVGKLHTFKSRFNPKDTDALFKKLFPDLDEKNAEKIKVAINYDAANLSDVIPSFATPLKMNYILDPSVSGTVTMSLKAEMSPREVWTLFVQILQMADAYCEMQNQVIHIRSRDKLPREEKMLQEDSNIDAQLVPLSYVDAKEIVAQLKPFLSDPATATALDRQNAVLLVETTGNMQRLLKLIDQIDRRSQAEWYNAVFICRNVSATQIHKELLELLPALGFPVADNKKGSETGKVCLICLDRIQAIIASAPTEDPLKEIQKWMENLDRKENNETEKMYVYKVVNGKAEELLNALTLMFPVESTVMSVESSGRTSTSSAATAKSSGSAPKAAATSVSSGKSAIDKDKKEKLNSIYDTPVKIFADSVYNRLLIRTTPRTYTMIRAILDRLDTVPGQVLMQVMVVEIELSNSNEFGMEFSMSGKSGSSQSIFGTNFESLTPNTAGKNPQSGGTFTIFNPKNPDQKFGYIRALASNSKLKVLSSPQIIAKSNAEAKFSVGKRVPIITNEITDTQSSIDPNNTSLRRSYQYEDTGIILSIRPQVTEGGWISMELEQTVSDAIENTMKGIESPIIKEDVLSTEMLIRDGSTLILGGLIKEKSNDMISSLPWVIDIPFLRTFFSNTTKTAERTEILMLVTATVIKDDNRLEDMIRRYRESISEIEKFEYRQFRSIAEEQKRKAASPSQPENENEQKLDEN